MRKLLLLIVAILVIGYVYHRQLTPDSTSPETTEPRRPSAEGPLDPARARAVGAEIGERTARAANAVVRGAKDVAGEAASAIEKRRSKVAEEVDEESGQAVSEARERGAQAASQVRTAATDGRITATITSKFALDDLVQARNINVDTSDGVVTLTGQIGSDEEHARALKLANQTRGVRQVVDRLQVTR